MGRRGYFLTDLTRLLKGYELYAAVAGGVLALFFSLERQGIINGGVWETYFYATELSGMILVYVFCAFPFAASFCEDLEKKYLYYQLIRGNLKRYTGARVAVIYGSSVFVMVAASAIFMLLCRTQVPWSGGLTELEIEQRGCYGGLIEGGHIFLYGLIYAFQLGLLAGTLSVTASFFSLFTSNKVMVWAVPLIIYQILMEYSGTSKFTAFSFRAYNKFYPSDWQNFLFVLALSLIPVILLWLAIYRKLRTRL